MGKKEVLIGSLLGAVILALSLIKVYYKDFSQDRSHILVFGTSTGYAPFVSIDASGNYEGFDIDIAHALAKRLGKKPIFKDLGSMSALFIALEQGTIDAIIWGLSITKSRLAQVDMIHYQGDEIRSYPLLFWKKIPDGVKTIDDMKDMRVCVEPASSQDVVLSRYTFIEKISTERVDDALLNIQYGKADAAFVEEAIARKFQAKYPEIKVMDVALNAEDYVEGMGIAIKKGNSIIKDQLQRAIEEIRKENVIQNLEAKWGIT
jgi:arginine transport system substrate-binding protein